MAAGLPIQVLSDHSVPVSLEGADSVTVRVAGGDTVYFADVAYVTSSSNQGSIANGGSQTFTGQVYLRSGSCSSVTVSYDDGAGRTRDVLVGSDGKVGGPGGTPLTSPVVLDSAGVNAPLVDGAANRLVNVPAWQANTAYPAGYCVVQGGIIYTANATFTSGATFVADAANWTALTAAGVELGNAQITTTFTTTSTTAVAVTGLSTTVTVGARPVVVKFDAGAVNNNTSGDSAAITIREDTVVVAAVLLKGTSSVITVPVHREVRRAPAAGSHTYDVQLNVITGGTAQIFADSPATNYGPAALQVVQV